MKKGQRRSMKEGGGGGGKGVNEVIIGVGGNRAKILLDRQGLAWT